ncbi:SbcC/MukB-like Walker B domain-containing protein [Candidatus Phytoplasma australasiaticum]
MKKLTKIQLVNWHFFSFQIIDIESNTLVSGENGSGKSTLLDALQYVLIGERNHVKFNIAANVNAKRSLESYMRCKIGAENKEFLRDQDVITHILLEFYDNVNKKYSIFGCVLELSRSSNLKEKFYFIENIQFINGMCVEDNQPKTQKQLLLFLRQYIPNFNFFDTKKQYQNAISNYLNINITKYIQMLPKALAFKPLNLQNFVFEFLLEPNPVNISSLKNSFKQLKKLELQIEFEKNKLFHLTNIIDADKKFIHLKDQIQIYQCLLYQIQIKRPFGNDSYQILIKPSNDPDYKKYYDVISSYENNESQNELLERGLMCENTLLEELFDKIISFEEGYEDIAESFLDYRNYMTYDIQIKDINNNYSLFSKIFREKSGGETQVPFYIIMSICFEQLITSSQNNQGCLVLFDEAFNNMDEARIEGMMCFFNSLKIQFIMAIPPQRIVDISPYVQTNLIIIKDNNHVVVENFTRNVLNF